MADVEEEVRGAGVVAVVDQLGQGEAEDALVEADGRLDVAADQAVWCSPRAEDSGRSPGGRRCSARIRSRSASMLSMSGVGTLSSLPATWVPVLSDGSAPPGHPAIQERLAGRVLLLWVGCEPESSSRKVEAQWATSFSWTVLRIAFIRLVRSLGCAREASSIVAFMPLMS